MGTDAPRSILACEDEDDDEDQLRQEVWAYLCQVHDQKLLRALRTILYSHVTRQRA